jgi:hypothetical protein
MAVSWNNSTWTLFSNDLTFTLQLNVDAQGNMVNSTLASQHVTSTLNGTVNLQTGKIDFIIPLPVPHPAALKPDEYAGYLMPVPPGAPKPGSDFTMAGIRNHTLSAGRPPRYSSVQYGWYAIQVVPF